MHRNLSDVDVPKHYLLQRFFLDLVGILQGIKRGRNKRIIIEYACTDFQCKLKKFFFANKHFINFLSIENSKEILSDFFLEITSTSSFKDDLHAELPVKLD